MNAVTVSFIFYTCLEKDLFSMNTLFDCERFVCDGLLRVMYFIWSANFVNLFHRRNFYQFWRFSHSEFNIRNENIYFGAAFQINPTSNFLIILSFKFSLHIFCCFVLDIGTSLFQLLRCKPGISWIRAPPEPRLRFALSRRQYYSGWVSPSVLMDLNNFPI